MAKISLGRGIDSLYGDEERSTGGPTTKIPMKEIHPNPFQPRKTFTEESLEELTHSIERHGLLHPVIVVRRDATYTLVSGERRFRAAERLGWQDIDAIIKDLTDQELLEIALVENLKRSDLNPLEIGEGLERLSREFDWTQENISEHLGMKRSSVANYLRLLEMDPDVKESLRKGDISFGHAKILSSLEPEAQRKWAAKVIARGLSVRALEEQIAKAPKAKIEKDSKVQEWIGENSEVLSSALQCRATIKKEKKGWKVELSFNRMDELEDLITKLSEKASLKKGTQDEA
ncbi:MAG: ParB/RepB/Spo0J family partition protein [Nitrospiraceae bacterium]|jgi:ParB family chromosome partitioning protein|nr:ParB/RepB/Spo0J family partition protein [Nitrospiraceae bacterium]